ncbi:MAG: ABC transporter permease, partial [Prolixibacteraceae bacterium]|nr:ABC transporter permease [Prolixibacteraceae bacterium]
DDFFNEIKQSMANQKVLMDNDHGFANEQKHEYQLWLEGRLTEKELLTPKIKEYIHQFSYGEIKKADIKINDVIKTIQDLKFKTAVEGQRDRRKTDGTGGIEQQELRGEQSFIAAILGFIPWLILSISPLVSFLFEKIAFLFKSIFRSNKRQKITNDQAEENSIYNYLKMSFKEIIPSSFYKLCVAWDWVNVKYTLFAKFKLKQDWIPFSTIPHDFKHLFYRNETKELLGKKNKHFWLIVVILFFTFLAIGFSNGSLKYLKDKMEDPFVRSINAPIPGNNRNINNTLELYNTDSLKHYYRYDTIIAYNKWTAYFKGDLPESPNRGIDGRSIPFNDPLVITIIDEKINKSIGNTFEDQTDISLIVTRNLIDKLECSKKPAFIFKKTRDGRQLPIPIRAIVDKLPGERVDFIATQFFYNNYMSLGDNFLFKDNKKLYALVVTDSTNVESFRQACDDFFFRYYEEGGFLEVNNIDVYPHRYSYMPMYWLQVSFEYSEDILLDEIDELYTQFRESEEIVNFMDKAGVQENELIQTYYPNQENRSSRRFDYIAVNFNDLSRVDEFAEKFAEDSGIKLEMAKIEQMKNYNFVSKLTLIMSIILIGFSVLMINIFLSNILSTHLNNIKMNIGTFKAFGIDIKRIYIGMMYIFILMPLLFGMFFAGVTGYLGGVYAIINLLSPFAVEKDLYFDLFNSYTLISIIILAIVNYYAFSKIINRIFKQSPGDLIYDRSNKA